MITQSFFQELEKQKAKLSMDQVKEKTNANKIKSQVKRKLKLQMLALEKNHKWIDVTSQQLLFWEFYTHNSVISATIFIKNGPSFAPPRLFQATHLLKSRNQVVQLPITPLF